VTADVAPANPTPDASGERIQEKVLRANGYKPSMRHGERVFCRREIPMGSRLPTTLKCVTVVEAEMIANEGKELTEQLQHRTPGCLSGSKGPQCGG
jgi:hypothetical protein